MSYFDPNAGRRGSPGNGGGEFRVVLEAGDIILQGETDTHDLPDPPAGKKYEYMEFDFLCALNTLTAGVDDITAENRSSGKFIHDSTGDQSSWYRSLFIESGGSRWYSGGQRELAEGVATFAVGLVHVEGADYLWSVEYNPTTHQLSFYRSGQAADANNNPIVYSALVTAFTVDA